MRASFYSLFYCSCFLAAGLAAQTPVDSLRAALSRQEGEPRYQTLQQLCYIYTRPLIKEKEGLEYARELMQMECHHQDLPAEKFKDCARCHDDVNNRTIRVARGEFSHRQHRENGEECASCHKFEHGDPRPPAKACLECHD